MEPFVCNCVRVFHIFTCCSPWYSYVPWIDDDRQDTAVLLSTEGRHAMMIVCSIVGAIYGRRKRKYNNIQYHTTETKGDWRRTLQRTSTGFYPLPELKYSSTSSSIDKAAVAFVLYEQKLKLHKDGVSTTKYTYQVQSISF